MRSRSCWTGCPRRPYRSADEDDMAPGIDEASPVPDETLLPELARWLGAIPPDARERVAGWSDATWDRFRQHVRMQGLAAVLADHLRAPGAEGTVPPALQVWLHQPASPRCLLPQCLCRTSH